MVFLTSFSKLPCKQSSSIFLVTLVRRRRLCKWLRDCLIHHSPKKMDVAVKFSARQTGFSLMCMITRKNCWLFSRLRCVTMVTALLQYKAFEKAVNSVLQKVNIGVKSQPTTNQIFVQFFVWQQYVHLSSDWSWQTTDLPNLSCGCKRTFRPWETVPSWTNAFCFLATEITNLWGDGNQCLQSWQGNYDYNVCW